VYFATGSTGLRALDAATGQLRWTYSPSDGFSAGFANIYQSGEVVSDGTVYAETGGGHTMLRALDAATGSIRWSYPIAVPVAPVALAPVAAGGTVYVARADHTVLALDAATGKPRWTYDTLGADRHLAAGWHLSQFSAPGGGTAYVFTQSGTVYELQTAP
jgi:outer membrane protein assembly factor BamB